MLFLLASTVRGVVAWIFFGAGSVSKELVDGGRLVFGWPVEAVDPAALPGAHLFLWLTGVIGPYLPVPMTFLYKLYPLLFDSAAAVALRDSLPGRRGRRAGLLYALCPVAVLICAVHGSWQCMAISLLLLSILLLRSPGRAATAGGGLALAAAIVASPLAALYVPLAVARSPRRWLLAATLGVCSAAYALILWAIGRPLGASTFARLREHAPAAEPFGLAVPLRFDASLFVVALLLPLVTLLVWRGRMSSERGMLALLAAFLAFAQLSPELLLWLVPFLLVCERERSAVVYTLAAGLFLLFFDQHPGWNGGNIENLGALAPLESLAWLAPRATGMELKAALLQFGGLAVIPIVSLIVCWRELARREPAGGEPTTARPALAVSAPAIAIAALALGSLAAAMVLPKPDARAYRAAVLAAVDGYAVEQLGAAAGGDRGKPVWVVTRKLFFGNVLPRIDVTFLGLAWLFVLAYVTWISRPRAGVEAGAGTRPAVVIPALCIALFLGMNVAALVRQSARVPSVDESEYLHAGALMHEGQRLYRDFFEHHSPLFFEVLAALVPDGGTEEFPLLDVPRYVARARVVTAAAGTLAVVAMGIVAFRVGRSLLAPLVAMAAVLGPLQTWFRGVADARYDPPALMLFWAGIALLVWRWERVVVRAAAASIGISLVGAAALWSPKWPVATLVAGVWFLGGIIRDWRSDRRVIPVALVCLLPVPLLGLAFILRASSLGDYIRFTFIYSMRLQQWFGVDSVLTREFFSDPFRFCGAPFKGPALIVTAILAAALVALAIASRPAGERPFVRRLRLREWMGTFDWQRALLVVALVAAAALEVRFIAPFPNIWPQTWLMWSCALAVLQGIACAALANLFRDRVRTHFIVVASLLATAVFALHFSWRVTRVARDPTVDWAASSYAQRSLVHGGTVWLSTRTHPIAGRDASYYWFGANEHVRFVLGASAHGTLPRFVPAMQARDLPPCRVERGEDRQIRLLIGGDEIGRVPEASRCMERLIAAGKIVPAPIPDVWRVVD